MRTCYKRAGSDLTNVDDTMFGRVVHAACAAGASNGFKDPCWFEVIELRTLGIGYYSSTTTRVKFPSDWHDED